jgi:histidinol-phosphate aminotransferase
LKEKLAKLKSVPKENIFIGNGSDEAIDLLFRMFCEPHVDNVIICPPTYGMYEVSANINATNIIEVPLKADFQLDIDKILQSQNLNTKVLFLCSPNNPTGNSMSQMEKLFSQFNGIIVIDEAYIDFSKQQSFVQKINDYPQLVVLQTLSKAWGLAAARVGLAFSNLKIIEWFNKIKPPYNVSLLNQQAAIDALDLTAAFEQQVTTILSQRGWLIEQFQNFKWVLKVYPSDANFLLINVENANKVYQFLLDHGIIIRNRHGILPDCIRITVGSPQENLTLIDTLKLF